MQHSDNLKNVEQLSIQNILPLIRMSKFQLYQCSLESFHSVQQLDLYTIKLKALPDFESDLVCTQDVRNLML